MIPSKSTGSNDNNSSGSSSSSSNRSNSVRKNPTRSSPNFVTKTFTPIHSPFSTTIGHRVIPQFWEIRMVFGPRRRSPPFPSLLAPRQHVVMGLDKNKKGWKSLAFHGLSVSHDWLIIRKFLWHQQELCSMWKHKAHFNHHHHWQKTNPRFVKSFVNAHIYCIYLSPGLMKLTGL